MSKYIDLELALNELLRLYEEDVDAYGVETPETFDYHRAREALSNLPTIEVNEDCIDHKKFMEVLMEMIEASTEQSSKVGRWAHYMGDLWTCTYCGESLMCDDIECNNFCPNCGAKMKG